MDTSDHSASDRGDGRGDRGGSDGGVAMAALSLWFKLFQVFLAFFLVCGG